MNSWLPPTHLVLNIKHTLNYVAQRAHSVLRWFFFFFLFFPAASTTTLQLHTGVKVRRCVKSGRSAERISPPSKWSPVRGVLSHRGTMMQETFAPWIQLGGVGLGGGSSGRLIESRFPSHTSCNHSTVGSVWKRGKAGGRLLIFDFSGDACKKKENG